jgi:hypothetical protein
MGSEKSWMGGDKMLKEWMGWLPKFSNFGVAK